MNTQMLKVLFSPLSYLRIRHEAKRWADWVYPLVFAVASTFIVIRYGSPGFVAGEDGLLSKILIVCSVLPGFYIASLAAIATFNRPDIDELMPPPTPEITQKIGGKKNDIPLTRRRFLSHLFAFLCFESLAIMVVCVFASLVGPNVADLLIEEFYNYLKTGFVFLVLLLFWQMLCGTLLGLYYFGDRLYRPY